MMLYIGLTSFFFALKGTPASSQTELMVASFLKLFWDEVILNVNNFGFKLYEQLKLTRVELIVLFTSTYI